MAGAPELERAAAADWAWWLVQLDTAGPRYHWHPARAWEVPDLLAPGAENGPGLDLVFYPETPTRRVRFKSSSFPPGCIGCLWELLTAGEPCSMSGQPQALAGLRLCAEWPFRPGDWNLLRLPLNRIGCGRALFTRSPPPLGSAENQAQQALW